MKAAVIDRYGSPEVFRYANVEQPAVQPDQMLVRVYASSVNPVDWTIRPNATNLAFLKQHIEANPIRSIIDRTYPLAERAAAHAYSETGRVVGKVVITVE